MCHTAETLTQIEAPCEQAKGKLGLGLSRSRFSLGMELHYVRVLLHLGLLLRLTSSGSPGRSTAEALPPSWGVSEDDGEIPFLPEDPLSQLGLGAPL